MTNYPSLHRYWLVIMLTTLLAVDVQAVSIDTVPVGNPGNAGQATGYNPYVAIVGGVPYSYRIGTYEVTNAQYAEFLNAKGAIDALGLYDSYMGTDPRGGITRSGASGSYSYSVKADMGNKPVNFIGFYDAARFVNWLNNGQGAGDTETGAYTLLGGTPVPTNGSSVSRSPSAAWVLPTEGEWYKAAYYDPRSAAEGGPTGDDHYWLFATKSDTAPTVATANAAGDISNPGVNVANYNLGADWNGQDGNVTTVGSAGPLSSSFYGTFDQGGNVFEWNEQAFLGGDWRGLSGGGWTVEADLIAAYDRGFIYADETLTGPNLDVGFRVAFVPEPSSFMVAAIGILGFLGLAYRRGCTRRSGFPI